MPMEKGVGGVLQPVSVDEGSRMVSAEDAMRYFRSQVCILASDLFYRFSPAYYPLRCLPCFFTPLTSIFAGTPSFSSNPTLIHGFDFSALRFRHPLTSLMVVGFSFSISSQFPLCAELSQISWRPKISAGSHVLRVTFSATRGKESARGANLRIAIVAKNRPDFRSVRLVVEVIVVV